MLVENHKVSAASDQTGAQESPPNVLAQNYSTSLLPQKGPGDIFINRRAWVVTTGHLRNLYIPVV